MCSFSVLRGCPSRWYDLGTTVLVEVVSDGGDMIVIVIAVIVFVMQLLQINGNQIIYSQMGSFF